jgi:hypothetical protein
MKSLSVAIYARVSSDQQTDAHTIASTVSRKFISDILRATFSWERCVCSSPTMQFG